jgi:hypothetical protein
VAKLEILQTSIACDKMSSQDEVLEYLIKILEETDLGVSLTLCVNGSIISGQMISSKRYFEELSSIYSEKNITTNDPSLIEKGLPILQQVKQFLQQKGKSREEQDNPKYIHLEKVVIYPSNPSQPVGATVWRGKLSSVDGFSIGRGYLKPREVEDVSD